MCKLLFLMVAVTLMSSHSEAKIIVDDTIKKPVNDYLLEAKAMSEHLARLITFAEQSDKRIFIKPMTEDRETWHYSGNKLRSHTEAMDNKRRGRARKNPTDAIIYINVDRVLPSEKTYKRGTLIHELVHALDLVMGKYHHNYLVREKRAIFFQNIWREAHNKTLRSHYHNRFKTKEYQKALKKDEVDGFVDYYFKHNDVPPRKSSKTNTK